jgi:hypothetical protein
VIQKVYNVEKRQASSVTSVGAALEATSRRPVRSITPLNLGTLDRHTEAKYFLKHLHLKRGFDDKRKAGDKKRKQSSRSRGGFKKQIASDPPAQEGETSDTGFYLSTYSTRTCEGSRAPLYALHKSRRLGQVLLARVGAEARLSTKTSLQDDPTR